MCRILSHSCHLNAYIVGCFFSNQDLAVPFNKPKLVAACEKLADDQAGRIYFG